MGDKKKQRTAEYKQKVIKQAVDIALTESLQECNFNKLVRRGVICKVADSEDDVI